MAVSFFEDNDAGFLGSRVTVADASSLTLVGILTASPFVKVIASLVLTAAVAKVFLQMHNDYMDFIALGPGGTPSTWVGYLRVKLLGCFALQDPYSPAPTPNEKYSAKGYLISLPKRQKPRPATSGIAPHRQTTQQASAATFFDIAAMIEALAEENGNLVLGTSCFEKHGTGLFATSPVVRTCGGEVCHAHFSDGSLHMTLHPADARIVLEAGWGERHPLARGGWFEKFVPGGFVMIYSPPSGDSADMEVVQNIIKAAIWHVAGMSEVAKRE